MRHRKVKLGNLAVDVSVWEMASNFWNDNVKEQTRIFIQKKSYSKRESDQVLFTSLLERISGLGTENKGT